MDLEQRLRATLVAPDPGARFTAAVMARVTRGRWYQRKRVVLMSTVVALGIAAAMLAWRLSGELQQPAAVVQVPVSPSPPAVATAAPLPEQAAEIPPAPPRPAAAEAQVEPPAIVRAAAPEPEASPLYTVVALLRHEAVEPEGRAVAQAFFDLLLDELRKVPGLTLRVWEGEPPPPMPDSATGIMIERAPAPLRDGEYGLTLVSLAFNRGGPVRVGSEPDANDFPWQMELRTGRQSAEPFDAMRGTGGWMASLLGVRRRDMAQQVPQVVENLRLRVFPLDSALRAQLIARVGDSALAESARTAALGSLLSAAGRTEAGAPMDAATVAATVSLLSERPAARRLVVRALRGHPAPALAPLLLESLDSADEAMRRETLVTLVADYSGNPEVRTALQTVAVSDPNELLRALASYPVSGMAAWRSYALKALREGDTPADKLAPLVFADDQTAGAFQKAALEAMANDAQIVEAVLALGRAARTGTDNRNRQVILRALNLLIRPEGGPVVEGTPRQEARALYIELGRVQQFGPRPSPEPAGSGSSPR